MKAKTCKVVIYKCNVKGEEVMKSCIYKNDGSVTYGTYKDGLNSISEVLRERGLGSKEGMPILYNEGIIHIESEESFLKNRNAYEAQVERENISYFANVVEESNRELDESIEYKEKKYSSFDDNSYVEDTNNIDFDSEIEDDEYYYDEEIEEEDTTEYDSEIEDNTYYDDGEEITVEDSEDLYINRIKKQDSLGVKIAAGVLGIMIGLGVYASCTRKSKTGEIKDNNISTHTITTTVNDDNTITVNTDESKEQTQENSVVLINDNNDFYNDYTFAELLSVTNNEFQKDSMINLSATLNSFNGDFANSYKEVGNDIKAALTVDETVALHHAYNKYSINEVRSYFNGSEVYAEDLSSAYKDASLQLMGAYVIETRENKVDMSNLIDSQEGKDFYNRYHDMFLAAKEATGSEKTRLINEFYSSIRRDFPITKEIRTSGISHADNRNSLKDYQLAVTPIIAASEILFEKTNGVNKLEKEEIDFLNDIGLCNYADDKFERIETIMLTAYEDNTNPTFEQYKNAIIKELTDRNDYVIDNAHRELANLRLFQIKVNGNNNSLGRYTTMYSDTKFIDSTRTYEEKKSWTETHTETRTETSREEKEIPQSEKDKIDRKIDDENKKNKTDAEKKAEEERRRQQEEENKNAKKVQQEVDEENQKTQDKIDDANKKIDNGEKVNEKDLGDNVHIDKDHKDNNGDINDSVKNITTDPRDADKPLPKPEDTEAEFNKRTLNASASKSNNEEKPKQEETKEKPKKVEEVSADDGKAYIEYDEDYIGFDENGEPITKKKLANMYLEALSEDTEEDVKVYVK